MIITLADIAKATGYSVMMVSRALGGHGYVDTAKKEHILRKAKQLGYRPNYIAKRLAPRKTYTVGLIIPDIRNSFFSEISWSVEETLNRKGYQVILCHSNETTEKEDQEIDNLFQKWVDGLIIAPANDRMKNLNTYLELKKRKIPLVLIDRYLTKLKTTYVLSDDFNGAYQAVEYLIKLGHKKIGHLRGPNGASTARDRFRGYKKALSDNGIKFIPELVLDADFYRDSGHLTMKKMLSLRSNKNNLPTAIFAYNDLVATGAWQAICEEGLKIPEDISLVGFANLEHTNWLSTPLTTVNQPKIDLGRTSAELLIEQMESKEFFQDKKIVLPTKLVIRKSTGPMTKNLASGKK